MKNYRQNIEAELAAMIVVTTIIVVVGVGTMAMLFIAAKWTLVGR